MEKLTPKQRAVVLAFTIPAALFVAAFILLGAATNRSHHVWRPVGVVVPTTYGPPTVTVTHHG